MAKSSKRKPGESPSRKRLAKQLGKDVLAHFPKLRAGTYTITSDKTDDYNCIAWAVNDTTRWWEPTPGKYWPPFTKGSMAFDALESAYQLAGFTRCEDGCVHGQEHIVLALYGRGADWTHAARRLSNGKWTSKLGISEDIQHDTPEVLHGPSYGVVKRYMHRLGSAELSKADTEQTLADAPSERASSR